MNRKQSHWYLLSGLLLGLAAGFIYAWVISPVRYRDADPAMLAASSRNEYRLMIAQALKANPDAGRAIQRLDLLKDADPQEALVAQAQQWLAEGKSNDEARALAMLSLAYGEGIPEQPTLVETVTSTLALAETTAGISQTSAPTYVLATFTPRPTATPAPTQGAPFGLLEREEDCSGGLSRLKITVFDAAGQPVAGVPVEVIWEGGRDLFHTGLKPHVSSGYADFDMQPGFYYQVRVGEGGKAVVDLQAPVCNGEEGEFPGSWKLIFQQP